MTAITAVIFSIAMVLFAFLAGWQMSSGHYIIGGFFIFTSLLELLLVVAYIWANSANK